MTPNEFYEQLQLVTESSATMTLAPGPLKIRIGQSDAMAAKLILWLQDEMPKDATIYDLFDVLAAATWWATFWSSLEKESGAPDPEPEDEKWEAILAKLDEEDLVW